MNIYDDSIRMIRKRTPSANNSLLIKTLQTAKTQETKYKALKQDVAKYFETRNRLKIKTVTENDIEILHALEKKLSKVGL